MIPTTRDVLDLLEKIAPSQLAEPWDNPGLQTGSFSQEISKIFMALDPTMKALISASERHAQLLLTHHPLIFKPLSQLDINAYPGNVVAESVRNAISVVAAHTNLDVAAGGMNDIMAGLLGLQHVEVLEETVGFKGVGLGRIGDLPEPRNLAVIVEEVKQLFDVGKPRVVAEGDVPITRIAVVGGSGGGLVPLAAERGADLMITGDAGHHHALEAEMLGIALMDAGHFHTEKTAFRQFAEHLRGWVADLEWEVEIETYEDEVDPMNKGLGN